MRGKMRTGMTLVEILVCITLIVILSAAYIMVANPVGQMAYSRNGERQLQLQTIMNGIRQNIADQSNEQFSCSSGALPTSTARMSSKGGAGNYNIAPCLIPTYGMYTMPFDPSASSSYFNSVSDYDTGYNIILNASGSVTLSAQYAELKQTITITR